MKTSLLKSLICGLSTLVLFLSVTAQAIQIEWPSWTRTSFVKLKDPIQLADGTLVNAFQIEFPHTTGVNEGTLLWGFINERNEWQVPGHGRSEPLLSSYKVFATEDVTITLPEPNPRSLSFKPDMTIMSADRKVVNQFEPVKRVESIKIAKPIAGRPASSRSYVSFSMPIQIGSSEVSAMQLMPVSERSQFVQFGRVSNGEFQADPLLGGTWAIFGEDDLLISPSVGGRIVISKTSGQVSAQSYLGVTPAVPQGTLATALPSRIEQVQFLPMSAYSIAVIICKDLF